MFWLKNKSYLISMICVAFVQLLNIYTVQADTLKSNSQLPDFGRLNLNPYRAESVNNKSFDPQNVKLNKFTEAMSKYNQTGNHTVNKGITSKFACGGSCGGGGSIIFFPNQEYKFLLDRLLLNPALGSIQKKEGPLSDDDRNAFKLAHQKILSWKNFYKSNDFVSFAFLEMLEKAIYKIPYVYINADFALIPRYYLPQNIIDQKPTVQTVIMYLHKLGDIPLAVALISEPVWKTLDDETKAGLLIHEGLRQIQFLYQFNDLIDKNLEEITALIIDREPEASHNLSLLMSPMLLHLCQAKAMLYRAPEKNENPLNKLVTAIDQFHSELELRQTEQVSLLELYLANEENINTFISNLKKAGILSNQ